MAFPGRARGPAISPLRRVGRVDVMAAVDPAYECLTPAAATRGEVFAYRLMAEVAEIIADDGVDGEAGPCA